MYAPASGIRARCGQVLYAALALVLFLPLFVLRLLQRPATSSTAGTEKDEIAAARRREQVLVAALRTPWVAAYVRRASSILWSLHDALLRPLFGCGVSTAVPYELAPTSKGGRTGSL